MTETCPACVGRGYVQGRQPPGAAAPPLLLTATQVAHLLSVCTRTVWRMVESGAFPQPIRWNRKLARWPRKVVDGWVAKQGRAK